MIGNICSMRSQIEMANSKVYEIFMVIIRIFSSVLYLYSLALSGIGGTPLSDVPADSKKFGFIYAKSAVGLYSRHQMISNFFQND